MAQCMNLHERNTAADHTIHSFNVCMLLYLLQYLPRYLLERFFNFAAAFHSKIYLVLGREDKPGRFGGLVAYLTVGLQWQ